MKRLLITILCVACPAVTAAAEIKEYLRDTLHLYDGNGQYLGPTSKSKLPLPRTLTNVSITPSRVEARSPDGRIFYFRPSEVLTDTGSGPVCDPIKTAERPTNLHLGADDIGAGSGLSQTSVTCVQSHH
jgi:hypothetical protein